MMEAAVLPWWIWPLALFAVTFLLGIVAVLAGVGGGVLFVPIVGGFFPFHLDFVRGAGWANVPVFNLLMGVPLKLSVGTSGFLLSVIDTSAAWVYINRGAVLPLIVAPSIIGVMLGAKIGARLLRVAPAARVRRIVIGLLLVAGARSLLKGLGWWH